MIKYKFNITALCRIFVIPLCLLLLVCFVGRPLTAQASATATIMIGAYGITKVVVSAKVLVGLIIGGFTGFLLEPLLEETDEWYESDPVIRNWADQYNGRITGGEVIAVPSNVQNAIRLRYSDINASVDLSTLYVPYDLTHLENVTAAHIFGIDVAEQLKANNSLLSDIKGVLNSLITSIENVPSAVASSLATHYTNVSYYISSTISKMSLSLQTNLGIVIDNIQRASISLQTDIGIAIQNIKSMSISLQEAIGLTIDKIGSIGSTISSTITNTIGKLETKVESISSTISTTITNTVGNLERKIEAIFAPGAIALPDFANPMQGSFNSENELDSSKNSLMPYIPAVIGQAKDVLSKYTSAFLAFGVVLTKFYNIPLIGDLVIFSIGIGIFALVVNLANTLVVKDSASSGKAKKQYSAKGG